MIKKTNFFYFLFFSIVLAVVFFASPVLAVAPIIDSITPNVGPATIGANVTIAGTNFFANSSIGGTITYTDANGLNSRSSGPYYDGYTVHTFNANGTLTIPASRKADVLVVAGGGGGGPTGSGGGGGGYRYLTDFSLTAQTYTVTVGLGGAGGVFNTNSNFGYKGNNSVFSTITAEGGGYGTTHGGTTGGVGGNGGGGPIATTTLSVGGSGTQGYKGGAGFISSSWLGKSGGGGGAGGIGVSGGNDITSGNGGIGASNSISGVFTYYAGGGGGGEVMGSNSSAGGLGGGGGTTLDATGTTGTANTGGGGGGGSYNGTYFSGGAGGSGVVIVRYKSLPKITFGGVEATNVTGVDANTFTATAPVHAVGTVDVVVTNPDGQSTTLASSYTYSPPPSVTSITPSSVVKIGGDATTVVGTNFVNGATVTFGGILASNVTFVNSNTLNVIMSAHDSGIFDVTVTNPDGQTGTLINGITFTDFPPTITSVTPNAGPTTGGTPVTISGTNFILNIRSAGGTMTYTDENGLNPRSSGPYINGYTVHTFTSSGTLIVPFDCNAEVFMVAGGGGGGDGVASANNGGGGGAGGVIYSPIALTSGTKTVTVGNGGIRNTNGANSIFNNLTAIGGGKGGFAGVGGTGGSGGGGSVGVAGGAGTTGQGFAGATGGGTGNPGGGGGGKGEVGNTDGAGLGGDGATYSISGLAKIYAGGGSGGNDVARRAGGDGGGGEGAVYTDATGGGNGTINTGSGGGGGASRAANVPGGTGGSGIIIIRYKSLPKITFGGVEATNITIVDVNTITATTPIHTSGIVDVVVTNFDGQKATLSGGYTYLGPPNITSITPSNVLMTGGDTITITGTDFINGATVTFGGIPAQNVTFINSSTLNVITPVQNVGTYNVVITNPDGQSGTLIGGITFTGPPPTITSVTPNAGSVTGGTPVTILGTIFFKDSNIGGSITYTDENGLNPRSNEPYVNGYIVHTFTSSGKLTISTDYNAEVLVVAGGGGGGDGVSGANNGGGGGAGGVIYSSIALTSGTKTVTVGNGGVRNTKGENSVFDTITAYGGGKGGFVGVGGSGGSGGGGANSGSQSGGIGTSGQGFAGAAGGGTGAIGAGGGGGKGEAGNTDGNGLGGDGVTYSISGLSKIYAGGGSGGNDTARRAGGDGGGGAGAVYTDATGGGNGTINTGSGGGGGASRVENLSGGTGGSGVVIIRYKIISKVTSASKVTFDGIEATNVTVVDANTITATTPAHTLGAVDVVVTNYDGQATTLSGGYTYLAPPNIISVTPSSVAKIGGDTITIIGTDFVNGATVTLGGIPARSVTFINSSTLNIVTSVQNVGTYDVIITNPDGQLSTLTNGITFTELPPIITSVTPNAGPATGGTPVTISGANFSMGIKSIGGTITYTDENGLNPRSDEPYINGYVVHTFYSNGTLTVPDCNAEVFVVAGGGGGGDGVGNLDNGGGGGGGGIVYNSVNLTRGIKTVTVGNGGVRNTNGANSVFDNLTAIGGGKGGFAGVGGSGGSGGGGANTGSQSGGVGTSGQGFAGAAGGSSGLIGAGGGGGGGEPGNTDGNSLGGDGATYSISGLSKIYAGGGSGGNNAARHAGGDGGGGEGAIYTDLIGGGNGTVNTGGGGGGGASRAENVPGGTGGSGIIIIRYKSLPKITFGGVEATNVTVVDANTITATTPVHTSGIVDVVVTNLDGQSTTLPTSFTYAPDKYLFSNSPLDIRETQPGTMTVTAADINGNAMITPADIVLTLSSSSAYGFFARSLTEDESTRWNYNTVTIPAGQSSVTFYYKDNLKGTPTITATPDVLVGGIAATQIETIRSQFRFLVTGVTNPVKSGIPSSVFIQAIDYQGNPVNNAYPPLTGNLGTIHFTSTDASAVLPVDFTFTADLLGRNTFINGVTMVTESTTQPWCVTATDINDSDITGTQCGIVVTAPNSGQPYQLKFINAPQSFGIDAHSTAITIQIQDVDGIPVPLLEDTPIYIYSTSATAQYSLSGSSDWQTINPLVINIAANTTSATFYYKDTTIGSATLTVKERTDEGTEDIVPIKNDSQNIQVGVGNAYKLIFSNLSSFTAGTIGGPFSVNLQDINGNIVTTTNDLPIYITTTSITANLATKSDMSDTQTDLITFIPAGGTTKQFYYADTLASVRTITVSDGLPANGDTGLLDDIQSLTVNPGSITKFIIKTAPFTLTAGNTSPVIIIEARDENNNASPVDVDTTVYLTSTNTGAQFSADPSFTSIINSVIITQGSSTAQIYFKQITGVTSQTITVSDATPADGITGIADDSQTETINPGAASKLVISNPEVASGLAGQELGPIVVSVQNSNGVEVPLLQDTTIYFYSTSTSSTKAFSLQNGSNWSNITSTVMRVGESGMSFYYKDTKAGTSTLTVSDDNQLGVENNLTNSSIQSVLTVGEATQVRIISSEQSIEAGQVSGAITIELEDQYQNPIKTINDTTVSLSSTSITGAFDSSSGGTFNGSITSIIIPTNSSQATFYYKDIKAGTPAVVISSTGLLPSSQIVTVNWGAVNSLQISTIGTTIVAGSVSSDITVRTLNAHNIIVPVTSDFVVTLASTHNTTGKFDTDLGGSFTGAINSATILNGQNNAIFYYKDTLMGVVTLTASHSGVISATQGLIINPGIANKIAFTTNPVNIQIGQKSGAITIQVQDQYNNPTSMSSALLQLTTTSTNGIFWNTANQQITSVPIVNLATIYYQDFTIGTPTITAIASDFSPITQTENVIQGVATKIGLSASDSTLVAGAASGPISVHLTNEYDQIVPATSDTVITLSSSRGGFDTATNGTFTTTQVTILAGENEAIVYYKDTLTGQHTIYGASNGFTTGSFTFNVNPNAVNQIVFINATLPTTIAGNASIAIPIGFRDIYGNVKILDAPLHVDFSTSDSTNGGFSTLSTGPWTSTGVDIPTGTTNYNFYYRDTKTGNKNITISSGTLTGATKEIIINSNIATHFGFITNPQTIVTQNPSSAIILQAYDAYNNTTVVTSNKTLNLTSTSGSGTFSASDSSWSNIASIIIPNGQGTINFYYKDSLIGTPTISVKSTDYPTITQKQTIIAGSATKLKFTSASQTIVKGTPSHQIGFAIQDNYGNATPAVSAQTVSITSSNGGEFSADGDTNWQTSFTLTINPPQTVANFYYRDSTLGSPVITISSPNLSADTQTESIINGAVEKLRIIGSTSTQVGQAAAITVQTMTAADLAAAVTSSTIINLSNAGGEFSLSNTSWIPITSITFNIGQYQKSLYFKTTTSGVSTITASVTAQPTWTNGTLDITVGAGAYAKLAFVQKPTSVQVNTASTLWNVQTQDLYGNIITTGATVYVFGATSGSFSTSSEGPWNISTLTIPTGFSTGQFYYKDSFPGTKTITVSDSNPANGEVNIIDTSASIIVNGQTPTKIKTTNSTQTIQAGTVTTAITIEARDGSDNPTILGADLVVQLAISGSSGAKFIATNNSSATAITTTTIPIGSSSVVVYFTDTKMGSDNVTFSSTGLTSDTGIITVTAGDANKFAFVSAPQTTSAGVVSTLIKAEIEDSYGNVTIAPNDLTLNVSSDKTGEFSLTDTPWNPVTTVSMAKDASDTYFYYKGTVLGTHILTIDETPNQNFTAGTQNFVVSSGNAFSISLSGSTQTLEAGQASNQITATLLDTYGNIATSTVNQTFYMYSQGGSGSFSSTNGFISTIDQINVPAGQSTFSFYYKNTVAGTQTIIVSDQAVLDDPTNIGIINGSQAEIINWGNAKSIAIEGGATMSAGVDKQLSASLKNNYGVIIPAQNDQTFYAYTNDNGTFTDGSTQITQFVLAKDQTSVSFYFHDTQAGTPTIIISDSINNPETPDLGLINASLQMNVLSASLTKFSYITAPQSLESGQVSSQIVVQAQDVFGNPVSVTSPTLIYLYSNSASGKFASSSDIGTTITEINIATGMSQTIFYYKDIIVGTATLTVSDVTPLDSPDIGISNAITNFTIINGNITKLTTDQSLPIIVSGGIGTFTVHTQNQFSVDTPVLSNTTLYLFSSSTTGKFATSPSGPWDVTQVTIAQNQSSVQLYYRDSQTGNHTLTVSDTSVSLPDTAWTNLVVTAPVDAGTATQFKITSNPQTITAKHPSQPITIEVQNQFGAPFILSTPMTVYLRTSASNTSEAEFSQSTIGPWGLNTIIIPAGSFGATFYYHDSVEGTPTITVADTPNPTGVGILSKDTQVVTIIKQILDHLLVTNVSTPQNQGDPSSVVVAAQDSENYIIQWYTGTITFSASDADAVLPTQYTFTSSDVGIHTFGNKVSFLSTGLKWVSAIDQNGITGTQTNIQVNPNVAGPAQKLKFISPNSPFTTNYDTASQTITLQLQDANDKPSNASTGGYPIKITSSNGTGLFSTTADGPWSSSLVTVIPQSLNSLNFYYKDSTGGTGTITASDWINGTDDTGIINGTINFVVKIIKVNIIPNLIEVNSRAENQATSIIFAKDFFGYHYLHTTFSTTFLDGLTNLEASVSATFTLKNPDGVSINTQSIEGVSKYSFVVDPLEGNVMNQSNYTVTVDATDQNGIRGSQTVQLPISGWVTKVDYEPLTVQIGQNVPYTIQTKFNNQLADPSFLTIRWKNPNGTNVVGDTYVQNISSMTKTGVGQYSGSIPTIGLTVGEKYFIYTRVLDASNNVLAENSHHDILMQNNPALAPKNLTVTKVLTSTPPESEKYDLRFDWQEATGATSYNLYRSRNKNTQLFDDPCTLDQIKFGHRFGDSGATTPYCEKTTHLVTGTDDSNSWVLMSTVTAPANTLTIPWSQIQSDLINNIYYYLLLSENGAGQSGYSSMVFTLKSNYIYNSTLANTNWISLPYKSQYQKVSDIVKDLEGGLGSGKNTKISQVSVWRPGLQNALTYNYIGAFKKWTGTDFEILPGDGISLLLSSVTSNFDWTLAGGDIVKTLTFSYNNDLANTNWISLPYSSKYLKVTDIVLDLEGGLGSGKNTKISQVSVWRPGLQNALTYNYIGAFKKWTGTDFTLLPGDGISVLLSGNLVNFDWTTYLMLNPY